ncbi:serine/threonine-protein kinase [Pelomicrobium sp.]|jgi:serine/threonine protein kinase|uniref:serine/threonine-protein kinase n=1 Tax=Pelomicrobium sp. TaxID=2815319 RepID=UPI002FDE0A48
MTAQAMPSSDNPSPPLPEYVGKYKVIRELGRGSTCRVYLAQDPFTDREVAVKVISPQLQKGARESKRFMRAFMSEATLAGRLKHPHIAAIYDAAMEEDFGYLVMEYVPGGTLQQFCDPARLLPLDRVVEIIFKCCRALDYAMRQGVIHRDVKPGNILVTQGTEIKITDFGTALLQIADHTQLTGVGSPAYMSPEQIREQELTHQTDIYSLGVVMYRLLTGRLPYDSRETEKLMEEILHGVPLPPSAHRPGLPPALDRIVLRAMGKELHERYPTWLEFARDLAAVFGQLQAPGQPAADTEKFSALRRLPFFERFEDSQIWEVLGMAAWRRVPEDSVIVQEGTVGESCFILVEGTAQVSRNGIPLEQLAPGDCFGLMLYFEESSRARTTSITALTECSLIELPAAALNRSSDACQAQFNKAFLRLLVNRLERRHATAAPPA